MAATGKTPILLYGSTTPTNAPTAGNLTNSSDGCEIAINVADKNLFFKDSTNAVNTVPIRQSSASSNGWLSSTDWSTFNNKQTALVSGTNIKTINGTTLLGSGDLGTIGIGYGGTGITSFGTGVQTALGQNVTGSGGFVLLNSPTFATGGTTSNAAEFYSASTTNGAKLKLSDNRSNYTLKTVPGASSTALALTYANDTSEFMRWFASGGVSIGNTTDPGAGNLSISGIVKTLVTTVANLPSASTVGAGARAFVTNALTPVFGSAVVGGGAVNVPVYSTGSAWFVG